MKKKAISVVIADDHAILRSGLRMLLGQQSDIKVVGEAENGEQALEQVRLKKPDILLADISMPGTNGIETINEIKKRSLRTRVVILTMHTERPYLISALKAGASGYVLKKALDSELISAIRAAHEKRVFICPGMVGQLVDEGSVRRNRREVPARQARDLLSRRELQVLKLVAEGYTHREIATRTFISVKSVETYRARLLKKLKITTRREIVRFAIDAGLLVKTA